MSRIIPDSLHQQVVEALTLALRQNEHDMLMTGEELRQCSAALTALAAAPVAQQECLHDETRRLGAIWTECTQCNRMWADDDPKNPVAQQVAPDFYPQNSRVFGEPDDRSMPSGLITVAQQVAPAQEQAITCIGRETHLEVAVNSTECRPATKEGQPFAGEAALQRLVDLSSELGLYDEVAPAPAQPDKIAQTLDALKDRGNVASGTTGSFYVAGWNDALAAVRRALCVEVAPAPAQPAEVPRWRWVDCTPHEGYFERHAEGPWVKYEDIAEGGN